VVIPSRVRNSEAHDNFIDKWRIGQFDARTPEVIACVKGELVNTWLNAFAGE
jgi:hypothetical protein